MEVQILNTDIAIEKKLLRSQILNKMKSIDPDIKNIDDKKILHNLTALPQYKDARVIFCFVSTDFEVNT